MLADTVSPDPLMPRLKNTFLVFQNEFMENSPLKYVRVMSRIESLGWTLYHISSNWAIYLPTKSSISRCSIFSFHLLLPILLNGFLMIHYRLMKRLSPNMASITKSYSLELSCLNIVFITLPDFPTLFNTVFTLWMNIFCLTPFSLYNFMLLY